MHWHTRTALRPGVRGMEATGSISCELVVVQLGYNDRALTRQMITYMVYFGVTLYRFFVQDRNTRSSWRTERDTVGQQLLPVVFFAEREETVLHVLSECRKMADDRPRGGPISPRKKSSGAEIELP
ncbi:hypothetical protein PoB_005206100 [Plakobranchus ocellatus]|uniref:Uncharacterized protein n=1 Tax=Plakobranchus ocellatus TaxID=259542 RepID=A0AAV4BQN4_9GAST|nr:hypothetical protein PoB_005206100 [Plakobranchus ocellatus]